MGLALWVVTVEDMNLVVFHDESIPNDLVRLRSA
jgi:hypothetical protein